MKKSLAVVLTTLLTIIIGLFCIGCADKGDNGGAVATPINLTISKKGTFSWDEVKAATYKVSSDGVNYADVETNEVDVFDYIKSTAITKLYVKAVKDGKESLVAELPVEVIQLSAPEKPEIKEDDSTKAVQFVWNEVENVNQYSISINNGKWSKCLNPYWTPSTTGEYTIKVKCLGYVKITSSKNQIFLASDESALSETLEFLAGPVVSEDVINVIAWDAEEEFDSYNIWVDGIKAKENVASPLNLVEGDEAVLTKTGEYDIQIEGIKGEKSAFSNVLEKVGTSNINPNEIYSFDNRVAKFIYAMQGAEVSEEKYYGDSGASLKIDTSFNLGRMHLETYAGCDVKLEQVHTISYWVYVDSVAGASAVDYVPVKALPRLAYDWNDSVSPYRQDFYGVVVDSETPDKVPLNTWVKIMFNGIYMLHDNVLAINAEKDNSVWEDGVARDLVLYVDEIKYEDVDVDMENVGEYDYKMYSFGVNELGGFNFELGADNANETVTVSFEVCGRYDTSLENVDIGFRILNTDLPEGTHSHQKFVTLSKENISSAWQTVTMEITLNAEGNVFVCASHISENGIGEFEIYIRNVSVVSK